LHILFLLIAGGCLLYLHFILPATYLRMKQEFSNNLSFSDNKERVNKLLNSLQVGILLQGPKSEILYSNKAALRLLGLSEDEIYRSSTFHPEWSVIHEDGSVFPGNTHPVPTAIATKKPVLNIIMGVFRPVTKDRVWLLVNAEPHLDEKGEVKEVVCSFSDITEHKNSEEKLTWLYQSLEIKALELATTNAELERFAYVATHDLQEPLRMVSSFMQLLKKKYEKQLDEQAREYILFAVEGANRIKKLILDLLEFSRVSSSKEEFTTTDMNSVLKTATQEFSKNLKEEGADIIIPALPAINANTLLMVQLFQNLIGNALKYRSSLKPVIRIGCKEEDDQFIFSVTDNGIGIDPQYSNKIFILFQRLHSKNKTYEGTGAGLAICKKIVELHGGTIWLISEPGQGSAFYFTIAKNKRLSA
jgi:signal transduction histidine kinase